MPGAYAHITMAFTSCGSAGLNQLGLKGDWKVMLRENGKYFELGAVSPDLPYLDILEGSEAKQWADAMHLAGVARRIATGVTATGQIPDADVQAKVLAWLLGFVEHVVFDVFMHPVVNVIAGGPYGPDTKAKHRECESHQDVFIVKDQLKINDLLAGEMISTGVASFLGAHGGLDPDIQSVWDAMLRTSCPCLYAVNKPDIESWYKAFVRILKTLEAGHGLVSLARHVGIDCAYPAFNALNNSYITGIATPAQTSADYIDLFKTARGHVLDVWKVVAAAVIDGQPIDEARFDGWNLDTGEDSSEEKVFW